MEVKATRVNDTRLINPGLSVPWEPVSGTLDTDVSRRIAARAAEAVTLARELPPPERLAVVAAWLAALESALGVRHDS